MPGKASPPGLCCRLSLQQRVSGLPARGASSTPWPGVKVLTARGGGTWHLTVEVSGEAESDTLTASTVCCDGAKREPQTGPDWSLTLACFLVGDLRRRAALDCSPPKPG